MDWIVKYAPKSLDEVMGNRATIRALREYLDNPDTMPHLLFYGKTGTGKTTLANILVNQILGCSKEMNYLPLNASDDRGIDVVRQRMLPFMRYTWGDVPFKILTLDEADAITVDSQNALKSPLEKYKHNCRVIMICNDVSKIIEPIREGRCTSFEFKRLSEKDVIDRLNFIIQQEGISNGFDLHEIYMKSGGSMRSAIAILQRIVQSRDDGMSEIEKIISSYTR
ncbi:MAG: AAA family ATPase [Candidatus Thorarchaeota archaeon]